MSYFFLLIFLVTNTYTAFADETILFPYNAGNTDCYLYHTCFDPFVTIIGVNETITWQNDDATGVHKIADIVTPATGSIFESDTLFTGDSFSHTFDTVGVYVFACLVHSHNEGIIIVEDINYKKEFYKLHDEFQQLLENNRKIVRALIEYQQIIANQIQVIYDYVVIHNTPIERSQSFKSQ